jgi:dienelactone hydrolase
MRWLLDVSQEIAQLRDDWRAGMKKIYVVVLSLLSLACAGVTSIQAQQKSQTPFWGELSAGPYAVGFRAIYEFDRTRTWRVTRGYEKPFAPDLNGRPIRVSVWYPAVRDAQARQLRFENYVRPDAPKEFAELNTILELREKVSSSYQEHWSDVLKMPVNAYANATPASGRFPLVLYAGGKDSTSTTAVFVLAEFLASHGYVVATVPLLGPTNENTEQGSLPSDRERAVQDLEFAWSLVRAQTDVDETKVGVFGKSLGGIEALFLAMRNGNVSAVVGLDATYGFKGLEKIMSDMPDYAPRKMRAAFLDIRRDWDDPASMLNLSAEHAFHYSDRSFVTIKKMNHFDFDSDAMIAFEFHLPFGPTEMENPGRTRETASRGYQSVCRMVLDFFDEKLKGDRGGAERLRADVARADGGVLKHEDALTPPPSGVEFAALIAEHGFDAATALVERFRRELPDEVVVDPDEFTNVGYRLIAERRFPEAIGIMRLIVYAYPDSANAADSLADAYIAAGQNNLARATLQQSLKVIPRDSSLSQANKQWMTKLEQAKLDQLKP